MQQKNTLTNKDRLLLGLKVILMLIWAVATFWTFSTAMTHGSGADKVVAGIMLAFNAYSLFLATGVPFEVCDELPKDGWTFLGDYSAQEMERGELHSPGTQCVARVRSETGRFQQVPETFEEFFKFRRTILPKLQEGGIPYVEEETPVVLGWYPDADACYLFNAEKQDKDVTLRWGAQKLAITLKSLDSALVLGGESLRLV